MFQNFDEIGGPEHTAERVKMLRDELARLSLTGLIIPRSDEFQNEYVPPDAEQLLWLTGFSGSWGEAAVLSGRAVLAIDGRYTIQAAAQIDSAAYEIINVSETTLGAWLAEHLREGDRLGYDPRLHTVAQADALQAVTDRVKAELVPVDPNPLTRLWTNRPGSGSGPAQVHPLDHAGVSAGEKIADIQTVLKKHGCDAAIIGPLDSIAWLFNIRGHDLPHTPFVIARAVVPSSGKAKLYIESWKITPDLRAALEQCTEIAQPSALARDLQALGEQKSRVQLDPARVSRWYWNQLNDAGAFIENAPDPCLLPKARKNPAEIKGARAAHMRDGAAFCRFLAWFGEAAKYGALDEVTAAKKLEEFRRASPLLRDISFDTIAAAGPNGAIVHYRPAARTSRRIEPGSLFLLDSGGQYTDGTTDITRTLAIGAPSADMQRNYTLVLKGHIAISRLSFPAKTRGTHIDALARRALWENGLDYDHGTGHGVGSFLSVHEGPQSIARRESVVLEPGMILSNEPGFYKAGAYGIRIENLILVTEPEDVPGGDRPMMRFETLTLAPYDRRLIDTGLLDAGEREWVDSYHRRVFDTLADHVDDETREWLRDAARALEN